jgi:hypothetical protein
VEANNAFGMASHMTTREDATLLDASQPSPTLDVNSLILILILLVVTYNVAKYSADTRNQLMKSTCATIADYTKPQYEQSYTDPLNRIFKQNLSKM